MNPVGITVLLWYKWGWYAWVEPYYWDFSVRLSVGRWNLSNRVPFCIYFGTVKNGDYGQNKNYRSTRKCLYLVLCGNVIVSLILYSQFENFHLHPNLGVGFMPDWYHSLSHDPVLRKTFLNFSIMLDWAHIVLLTPTLQRACIDCEIQLARCNFLHIPKWFKNIHNIKRVQCIYMHSSALPFAELRQFIQINIWADAAALHTIIYFVSRFTYGHWWYHSRCPLSCSE